MRVDDKIMEIEKYLQELSEIVPGDFEEYRENLEKKAACERYFQKIIEAAIDLTFLVIKENKLKTPEENKEALDILSSKEIISNKLSEKLKDTIGMRNFIIHQYEKLNDEIVFEALTEQLERDIKEFISSIKSAIKKRIKKEKP